MKDLERYKKAMEKITAVQLLELPEDVKNVLKSTTDLKTKAKMLEKISELNTEV